MSARLSAGSLETVLTGTRSANGDWSVAAFVQDFDFHMMSDLFTHMTGDTLTVPEKTEVTLGSGTIQISKTASEKTPAFSVMLDNLSFDNYTAPQALLNLSATGVSISASIPDVPFKGITLKNAAMKVAFEGHKSARTSDVALAGTVEFSGCPSLAISAAVHLYTGDKAALEWTVYGTLTTTEPVVLSHIAPKLGFSAFGKLGLNNFLFVAASQDDPATSELNPQKYDIHEGMLSSTYHHQRK